ncbi:MAG: DUF4347 domain-containing protein [Hyphomicrobiaceae bacterium]
MTDKKNSSSIAAETTFGSQRMSEPSSSSTSASMPSPGKLSANADGPVVGVAGRPTFGPGGETADSALDLVADAAVVGGSRLTVGVSPVRSIVFIDAGVTDVTEIMTAAVADAEIIMLDRASDGLDQIAGHLDGKIGIRSIEIVSRGEAGKLALGCATLNLDSITGTHAGALAIIHAALAEGAGILLHGSNLAAGERGRAFLSALSEATGARIAITDSVDTADAAGGWSHDAAVGAG